MKWTLLRDSEAVSEDDSRTRKQKDQKDPVGTRVNHYLLTALVFSVPQFQKGHVPFSPRDEIQSCQHSQPHRIIPFVPTQVQQRKSHSLEPVSSVAILPTSEDTVTSLQLDNITPQLSIDIRDQTFIHEYFSHIYFDTILIYHIYFYE